ncbi:50S ribosomal protein L40e [Nanoarchaeota archaeon]|nr:MAG: 50S ribosomal protein L40e [Nanoarchaeota archaeon]
MPIIDPVKLRIAQYSRRRHFKLCRKCHKKFRRSENKCPRCGSRNIRIVHLITGKRKH